jgi:phenylacetate-CoA ligase
MIILRGVNLFPTQIEELALRVPGLSAHFQCLLSRPHRLDELTVRIEAASGTVDAEQRARLGRELKGEIKSRIGVTVAVDVTEPGTVERSVGKMRRVIDNRPKS